ncbi:MAG TPA: GTPase Era [Hypericibacter adhaerens]|uniref:GTPase Era n=1 Tax=Hypericibacter adhaerens TaxID=2602016 RepID=UPI002CC8C80F|nr:GTPase Era [Hypericibacter adhaerens]HWA44917.1 GTPase Era [Hypericibacter adhaerens]
MSGKKKATKAGKAAATRCGFVAVIGAPNAGKSTLVNRLVGAKVSIVSPKVQTTRSRVLGIAMRDQAQILFVDTPGIFAPRRRLDRAMVAAAWQGAGDADLVVLLIDASHKQPDEETERILADLKRADRKIILALNKVDLVKQRERLLTLASAMDATGCFSDIFMISAETGDGVEDLMRVLVERLPEGPWLYPEDQITDVPLRLLAAEVTREHLFRQLHQEVPYALTVETESWEDFQDGSVKIQQAILVEREGQKAIVIGKGGARAKAVREAAQAELQEMLDRKVHLFLAVKVKENWSEERDRYKELGLDWDA